MEAGSGILILDLKSRGEDGTRLKFANCFGGLRKFAGSAITELCGNGPCLGGGAGED